MNLERHPIDLAQASRAYELQLENQAELVQDLRDAPKLLPGVVDASHQLAALASVVDANGEALLRAVATLAEAAAASFTLHAQKVRGEPLSFEGPIGGRSLRLEGFAPNKSLGATNHQLGIFASLISRDAAANHRLCLVPGAVTRQCGVVADELQYEWLTMLQRFSRNESLAGMLEAVEASGQPGKAKIAPRSHVDQTLALARATAAVDRGDAAAVAEHLGEALTLHRKIWEGETWRGYLSFATTAIVCRATDRGLPIALTSAYVPARLVSPP